MTARLVRILALLPMLSLPGAAAAWNAANNGDFTGGTTPWSLSGSNGGGASWESVSGSPAGGSLRLQAFGITQTAHADECIDVHRWFAVDFSLRKAIEAEGNGGTHPFTLEFHDTDDCTGEPLPGTIVLPEAGDPYDCSPGCWIEVAVSGSPIPSGALTAKVNLDAIAGPTGYSYYLIDHVQVVPPDEIFPDAFDGG